MLIGRRAAIGIGAAATACLAGRPLAAASYSGMPEPADLLQIRTTLMRLAWAIDTADAQGAAAAFAPDAIVHDMGGRIWRRSNGGAAAFVESAIAGSEAGVQHHVQINRLEPAGRRWMAESYWSIVGWKTGAARPELFSLGAYVDQMVRRDARWLIAERRVSLWNSETIRVPVVKDPGQ